VNNNLVSIITPLYNNENFLNDCITSVINQTYKSWEMLIVDDKSTDNSYKLALNFSELDSRIKVYQTEANSGAGLARNLAIEKSNGKYIAFLDSDDIWHHDKLKIHIKEMIENNASFSHTSYGYLTESGVRLKKTLKVSSNWIGYYDLLKKTEISCLTAIYDAHKLGKVYMPDIRRKQDYGLWLSILRKGVKSYPVNQTLAWYRQVSGSATSKKHKLILKHYKFLRQNQGLNFFKSIYYTFWWGINGIKRYYF